jgi:hypothetical protein
MSTSHITFRRRLVRRGALALAVSAICLPSSALARGDTKGDYPGTTEPSAAKVGDNPADYPGSAGAVGTDRPVAQQRRAGDTPADFPGMPGGPVVVREPSAAPEAGGFDWTSAAIGAGGAGLLIVISLGGAAAASHIRMRTVRS